MKKKKRKWMRDRMWELRELRKKRCNKKREKIRNLKFNMLYGRIKADAGYLRKDRKKEIGKREQRDIDWEMR